MLYTEFLQKTNQSKIQEHEQHNSTKMIDPPQVPMAPVAPNRPRTILIGFLISLLAGVGLVFFLEYLDNTVKTVEDVTRYAQLPALSVIPAIGGRRKARAESGQQRFEEDGKRACAQQYKRVQQRTVARSGHALFSSGSISRSPHLSASVVNREAAQDHPDYQRAAG